MTTYGFRRLAFAGALVIGLTGVAAPARATTSPNPLDPIINLLGPVPAPYVPYTGTACPTGARSCIDTTIAEMKRRLAMLAPTCSHDAVFSLAYLRVTEDVRDAMDAGHFADRTWLSQVDANFAHKYFDTLDAWRSGNKKAVPQAWQIALQASEDRSVSGLGSFMLAMNAHINRDFSYVLAEVGLTAKDGTSHKADHNAYNPRLDALYIPVFTEEAARFDPTFDDFDLGTLDDTTVGVIMRGWREMVWRNAERLVLAKTPFEKMLAEQIIENYATTQAVMIRALFATPNSQTRDNWCATHHG